VGSLLRRNLICVAAAAVLFPLLAMPQLAGGQGSKAAPKAKKAAAPAVVAPKEIVKAFGSRTAPITMEVFSDFQCPACRTLFLEAIQPMMNDYVRTGKVYFVHRDNPLTMHPYARDAARLANAAAQIDKFEKVAAAIYAAQPYWAVDRSKLDAAVAGVLSAAEMNQVRAAMSSSTVDSAIEKDLALGRMVPVGSTPTVVLIHRGQRINLPGTVSYSLLRQVLDQLLSQR